MKVQILVVIDENVVKSEGKIMINADSTIV
jgi:hypothetical protein